MHAGPGLVLPTTRWAGDARLTDLAGDHFAVGAVGYFGLGCFTLGLRVLISSS